MKGVSFAVNSPPAMLTPNGLEEKRCWFAARKSSSNGRFLLRYPAGSASRHSIGARSQADRTIDTLKGFSVPRNSRKAELKHCSQSTRMTCVGRVVRRSSSLVPSARHRIKSASALQSSGSTLWADVPRKKTRHPVMVPTACSHSVLHSRSRCIRSHCSPAQSGTTRFPTLSCPQFTRIAVDSKTPGGVRWANSPAFSE